MSKNKNNHVNVDKKNMSTVPVSSIIVNSTLANEVSQIVESFKVKNMANIEYTLTCMPLHGFVFSDSFRDACVKAHVPVESLEAIVAWHAVQLQSIACKFDGWKYVHDTCAMFNGFHDAKTFPPNGSKSFMPLTGTVSLNGHAIYKLVKNSIQWRKNMLLLKRQENKNVEKVNDDRVPPEVPNETK